MNIILKIKNKVYSAIINKLRNMALKNMENHILDDWDKFEYWADKAKSYNKILYSMELTE